MQVRKASVSILSGFSSFGSRASFLILVQIFVTLFSLVSAVFVARYLGVEARGYLTLSLIFPSLLIMFTDFGMGPAVMRFCSMDNVSVTKILYSQVVIAVFRFVFLLICGAVVLRFFKNSLFPNIPTLFLYLSLLQVVPLSFLHFVLPAFFSIGKIRNYGGILTFNSFFPVLIIGFAYFIDSKSLGLILGLFLLGYTVSVFWMFRSIIKEILNVQNISWPYLKQAFSWGIGIYFANIASYGATYFSLIIINKSLGVLTVGFLTVAQSLADRIYLVSDAIATVLMPKVASDIALEKPTITPLVFRLSMSLFLAIVVVLWFGASWLIPFLFSSKFLESVPLLRWLLIAAFFNSGWRILSQDFNGRGNSLLSAKIESVASLIYLTSLYLFSAKFGIYFVVGCFSFVSMLKFFIALCCHSQRRALLTFSSHDYVYVKNVFLSKVIGRDTVHIGVSGDLK